MWHNSSIYSMTHSYMTWQSEYTSTYQWVMSRMNEACHVKYKWVMSHMEDSCHTWMSHIIHECRGSTPAHINESRHIWMRHVAYDWVMSRMNESCHIWMQGEYTSNVTSARMRVHAPAGDALPRKRIRLFVKQWAQASRCKFAKLQLASTCTCVYICVYVYIYYTYICICVCVYICVCKAARCSVYNVRSTKSAV